MPSFRVVQIVDKLVSWLRIDERDCRLRIEKHVIVGLGLNHSGYLLYSRLYTSIIFRLVLWRKSK